MHDDNRVTNVYNGSVLQNRHVFVEFQRPPTLGDRLAVASCEGALWFLSVLWVLVSALLRVSAIAGARLDGVVLRAVVRAVRREKELS